MEIDRNKKPETLVELLITQLRTSSEPISSVYYGLFSILPYDYLNSILEYVYEEYEEYKDKPEEEQWWFYNFHKSMRQTDFYNGCTINYKKELSEEKETTLAALWKEIKAVPNDQFPQWKLDHPDKYREYRELLKEKDVAESINGWLDTALWYLVHVDEKSYLYDVLVKVFADYKRLQDTILKPKPKSIKKDTKTTE